MFESIISKFGTNKPKYNLHRIEMHITDHCNLNCMACAHFSNISPEYYMDIEIFEKDLAEITKKINYKFFHLLGGEPLLHPEISKFFYVARKYCPDMQINLITNGVLLPTMKEDFWTALRETDINLIISRYPVNKDKIETYTELIKEKKCNLLAVSDGMRFYLRKKRIADSDKNSVYEYCNSNVCHQLYKGMLYPCPTIAYGHFYNEHFNQEFFKCKGIDIYKSSAKEIYKFMTNPHDDCAGCTIKGRMFDWKQSEYKQEEWDAW